MTLKFKETEWGTNTGFVCGFLTPELPQPLDPMLLRREVNSEGSGVGSRGFKCKSVQGLIGDLVMLMV